MVPYPKGFGSLFHVVRTSIVLQTADLILWHRKEMYFTELVKVSSIQSGHLAKRLLPPPPPPAQGGELLQAWL